MIKVDVNFGPEFYERLQAVDPEVVQRAIRRAIDRYTARDQVATDDDTVLEFGELTALDDTVLE